MYEFIDTQEGGGHSPALPSEAVIIDGIYLDELDIDFKTLYVKGRDSLGAEVETTELRGHGSIYRNRRYPEREIIVGFQILSENAEEYRRKWNTLAGILNKDLVELRFADEPDKFFKAVPAGLEQPEPGRLNVKTELTFICPDPFKYSDEKELVMTPITEPYHPYDLKCDFVYDGTVDTLPLFDIQFGSQISSSANQSQSSGADCSFINVGMEGQAASGQSIAPFYSMTFGDMSSSIEPGSGAFVEYKITDYFRTLESGWVENNSPLGNHYNMGSTGVKTYSGPPGMYVTPGTMYRGITDYGTLQEEYWHGPSLTYTVTHEAYNYHGYFSVLMTCGPSCINRRGAFVFSVFDANDNIIFDIMLCKLNNSNNMDYYIHLPGDLTVEDTIAVSGDIGEWFFSFKKFGKSIQILRENTILAQKLLTTEQANVKPNKVTYTFLRQNNQDELYNFGIGPSQDFYLTNTNGITFTDGDHLVVNCNDGSIKLNNFNAYEYSDVTNRYDKFKIRNGNNTIYAKYSSDYTSIPPTVKVKYREVYI